MFTIDLLCLKKMPQKWALFEHRFSTPTLTCTIENNFFSTFNKKKLQKEMINMKEET